MERQKVLSDHSEMPYGAKHKGKLMANVPSSYLLWAYNEPWCKAAWPEVFAYVEKNKDILKMDVEL